MRVVIHDLYKGFGDFKFAPIMLANKLCETAELVLPNAVVESGELS